ncbi:MAG: hypothetical protein ASARMPREDX12_004905 [Alectoria sarmentosa]|nr:MAG: hypothetical protein ASARMPREDX12_004905 [Alectoria sarmentosa]
MKRSDLATPKGIDHDYNYLTSIERELDHAEKNATSRGFVLEEERRRSKQPVKGVTQFNSALERCGVVVAKAPKGMTRSKQNETICSKKKRTLLWTVEWVHPDGRKTLDKLWETKFISTAYDDHVSYLDTSRPKKRRKPSQRHKDLVAAATLVSLSAPVNDSTAGAQPNGSTSTASVGKRKRDEDEAILDCTAEGEESNTVIDTDPGDAGGVQNSASVPSSSTDPPMTKQEPTSEFDFYLHHPSLPSRRPVLVPLPPDAKLATSLTNRLILEFPTIYVLPSQAGGRLPEGFVSEEDFFASAKKELIEEIAGEGTQIASPDMNGDEGKADLEDGELDEGRLREVLGKDLKGIIAGSL